jgi:hypothetical protein
MTRLQRAGLSHSEIRGSRVICTSPRLFAAYRVLLRLRGPRHPPCALPSLCYLYVLRPAPMRHSLAGRRRRTRGPSLTEGPRRGLLCSYSCWRPPEGRRRKYTSFAFVSLYLVSACQMSLRTPKVRLWRITDSNR